MRAETGIVARHVRVAGLVQGVFFRATTRQVAQHLGLDGWVRNCADGTVEAHFQGPRERVEEMVAWCTTGPEGARVERLDIDEAPLDARLRGFSVRL